MRAGNCTQDFTEPHFQSQCGSRLEAAFQLALLVLCIFYYGEYKGEKGVNCLGYLPIPEVNIEVIMELFVKWERQGEKSALNYEGNEQAHTGEI